MPYKIYMELFPKPDSVPRWMWEEEDLDHGRHSWTAHAPYKTHRGGKAWTATISGSVFEYSSESDATTRMTQLSASSAVSHSGRRFKVVEVT